MSLIDTAIVDLPDESQPSVMVHLVHGTWPYGPLGRPAPQRELNAWFEPGGRLYRDVHEMSSRGVAIDVFHWSGGNSFKDRSQAAESLQHRLIETQEQYPDIKQVVIAHSHGGTLAAEALAGKSTYVSRSLPPVAALICLSTPFVYRIPRQGRGRLSVPLAFSTLLTGVAASVLLISDLWRQLTLPHILLLHAALYLLLTVAFITIDTGSGRAEDYGHIPYLTPVYLLRSTRDEASLSIGLTQTMTWITGLFYRPTSLRVSLITTLSLSATIILLIGALMPDAPTLDLHRLFVPCFFICLAILPAIYLVSMLCLAIATGAWNPLDWGKYIIETEHAPPGHTCFIKSYRDPGTLDTGLRILKTGGLRHSQLYDQDQVLQDIRYMLDDILSGRRPALVHTSYKIGLHSRHI